MLVLTRKAGERIRMLIDSDTEIVVEIAKVTGSKTSVAVSAPAHVKILRGELEAKDDSIAKPSLGSA